MPQGGFGGYTLDKIGEQFKMLQGLWGQAMAFDPNVTSGIFGEEARMKRSVGTGIAASGADVSGTFNKLHLFQISSDFAAKRMQARNMAEQGRLLRLLGISQAFSSPIQGLLNVDQLRLQRDAQDFNIADLIPGVNINV